MQSKSFALEITLACAAIGCAFLFQTFRIRPAIAPEETNTLVNEKPLEDPHKVFIPTVYDPNLSDLGTTPDWSVLEQMPRALTRERFEFLLTKVFTVGETWKQFITIDETSATVLTDASDDTQTITISFAPTEEEAVSPKRYWKNSSELRPARSETPLQNIHIAIDPGHIGGNFSKLEERWFSINGGNPVREGNLTLDVALALQPRLEALGAKVSLIRSTPEPVLAQQPADFEFYANSRLKQRNQIISVQSINRECERLFYRAGEIRARASIINQVIQPDIVLCLHFNAESWGDPSNPTLTPRNHLHLLLNGAYTSGEVANDDERFTMLKKILQENHTEELSLGSAVAASMASITGLPPYLYEHNSSRAVQIDNNPYLWARNLIANRLYDCPVVFLEPYVMNSIDTYMRVQAGDYDGKRDVNGLSRISIIQEYAKGVSKGLENHYRQHRQQNSTSDSEKVPADKNTH